MRPLLCLLLFGSAVSLFAADDYQPGPDSKPQADVPQGEVLKGTFDQSKIFPGTWREYWVYVPRQLDSSKPAPVMVFQDGLQYSATNVFNNLIHKKEIPPLVGVFVMHGRVRALDPEKALDRFNRSYEYDGLGDNYARFLLDELLPFIAKAHQLNISTNGNDRAIAGASSGAGGDWWMANQEMERALVFAGYDVNHVWGDGGHNGKQATAIFPDSLRWLWRDWPAGIKANPEKTSKQPVAALLGDSEWQLVSQGYRFTEGPAANAKGEVFFTDIPNNRIHKIGLEGKVTAFEENTGGANGLMFGPDGRLYACANGRKQIVAYDESGKETVVAEGMESNDLCITHNGDLYVTDPGNKQVWFVSKSGEKKVVDKGIEFPNGIILTPDQSLLYVCDTRGQFVYSYQIQSDGSLAAKQRYFHLHEPDGVTSGADGMTVDTDGRLYVATALGVQFCDQAGRVNGIISKPQRAWLANLCFGGPSFDELYATCGDKVFKRKLKAKGVLSFQAPIKPAPPRL